MPFLNISSKRILGELRIIEKKAVPGFSLKLQSPENLKKLDGIFFGFPQSPYEGGEYIVEFKIPEQYPIKPPKAYFKTKIWHPNISSKTGCICLNILSSDWELKLNLLDVMQGIYSLLVSAEPDDPQDAQVAAQYKNHADLFEKTAAFWNYQYAGGKRRDEFDEFEAKIKEIMERGYSRDESIHALSMKNWDVTEAFNIL